MKTGKCGRKGITVASVVVAVLFGLALTAPVPARAADNQGTGDIAGDDASLSDSNIFTLFTTTLALNKTAFLADGTQLASGATLPTGTEVRFVIYVDNPTSVSISDVSVQDVLDPLFAYQPGSIKVDSSLVSGSSEAQIYAAVNAVPGTLTDAIDADIASASGSTIDIGDENVSNGRLDIPADSVWAVLFRVVLQ